MLTKGVMDQEKTKSLLLKICGNPATDPGAREGLRCARGFAVDGRWEVAVQLCGEGANCLHGCTGFDPEADVAASLEELAAKAQIIVALEDSNPGNSFPEWILIVSSDEMVERGLSAEVVLVF
ncbi:MAG: hypothetical protein ACFHW5_12865 [Verrucomicrobiota bacterium]|jgi:hypothetical protein